MVPNRSEYQPISQSADDLIGDLSNNDSGLLPTSSRSRNKRRLARPGTIDLRNLDVAFKRWTESIAQKVKGKKKKGYDDSRKEILRSVFDPQIHVQPTPPSIVKTLDHGPPMSQSDYDRLVMSVQKAISEGIHPKMITKGSSGSYFARAKIEGRVQTVAVFKPKDEEPYGRLNPKTTKWLHRQFRWLIPFGRACLIPNLSYISEAAASLLDDRLNLNIVPKTQLVSFSSPAFFYDWLDRNAAKKGKPLPEKIGSLQCFMHGYQDASDFLRKHPWPGRSIRDTFDDSTHRTGKFKKRFFSALKIVCGKTGDEDEMDGLEDLDEERVLFDITEDDGTNQPFYWSATLQQSFREELEKLVILDYIMHNTDRGADNYMIKYCEGEHEKSLVDVAPSRSSTLQMPAVGEMRRDNLISTSTQSMAQVSAGNIPNPPVPSRSSSYMKPVPYTRSPHIHIAAIDNSLAFPHEHPRGWRSYTYGWLYLPVSIIGQPFSQKTRDHFLPLLTSKAWWEETTHQLRKMFAVDPDFNRKMFQRQLAVIKGQAYNVVQSLKHSDEGPLELTRRQKHLVWDDEVEVADDTMAELFSGPLSASPKPSVKTLPVTGPTSPQHRRTNSHSALESPLQRGFPPPARRSAPDSRPVPFVSKLPRIHPGTSGVTVLEHMERVDAVEAGLRRLAVDDGTIFEEEEDDVGLMGASPRHRPSTIQEVSHEEDENGNEVRSGSVTPTKVDSGSGNGNLNVEPTSPLLSPTSDYPGGGSLASSMTEEDLVTMSQSTSALEPRPYHVRASSQQSPEVGGSGRPTLDWIREEATERKRIMIVERLEVVEAKPLCSCW